MLLARLGIRQKLALLLSIPLIAVVVVLVPFTAERVTEAAAADVTARTAETARRIGSLIQTLQQERLLALGYLSAPNLDRSALVSQTQTAIDDAERLLTDPTTAATMRRAQPALDALADVREAVTARRIGARTTYDAFRDANSALLEALQLANPPGADGSGLPQLGALDALMRSNEEASSVGAILVAAAGDPNLSRALLSDAVTADQQHLRRFRDLVTPQQAALVDTVENGLAGQRIRQMILAANRPDAATTSRDVSEALTAAVSYTALRRLAQDRIAREIATDAQNRATAAGTAAVAVTAGAVTLLVVVLVLGFLVSRSISLPIRRLTRAAGIVADLAETELVRVADSDSPDPAPPKLAAVQVDSTDELGDLAAALNKVQATAAMLLDRQVISRRNVAVMFANIGRRTQNLAGRQLSLIEDLERNESDPEMLTRLYRLDHVATRLRRSADSLLVVSGTIEQVMSGEPVHLADVVRSALGEIEGFQAVQFGQITDVAVSSTLVTDLRLLLAELLENATNFSPPATPVRVSATLGAEECAIFVVDHGIGMGPARLEEENRRLVERERLDLAPTTMLGLFVVGRLARRHGLTVRLEQSEGRGVTATVRIPLRLLHTSTLVAPRLTEVGPRVVPAAIQANAYVDDEPTEPFDWFGLSEPAAVGSPAVPVAAASSPLSAVASVAGPADPGASAPRVDYGAARMDFDTARVDHGAARLDRGAPVAPMGRPDPASAPLPRRQPTVAEPMADPEPEPRFDYSPAPSRSGLTRRVPGTNMAEGFADAVAESPTIRSSRDPEAERDAINDFLAGLVRGGDTAPPGPVHSSSQSAGERPS
jgi:signal transduction histidine kinase